MLGKTPTVLSSLSKTNQTCPKQTKPSHAFYYTPTAGEFCDRLLKSSLNMSNLIEDDVIEIESQIAAVIYFSLRILKKHSHNSSPSFL